jgi:hypothetical protein
MMGRAFQSPFANPPGTGLSSALVNVGWGAVNIALGTIRTAEHRAHDQPTV